MYFVSFEYLIFLFTLFFIIYIFIKKKREYILLLASIIFCGYINLTVLGILSVSIISNYIFGIILEKNKSNRIFLNIAVFLNVAMLLIVKYFVFSKNTGINIVAPLGISYYTLQNISYLFEIKNKKIKAEKNMLVFALLISFFPKLIVGPIEKVNSFLLQIKNKQVISDSNISNGCRLILWGFFKKLVIVNNISYYINIYMHLVTKKEFLVDVSSLNSILIIILLGLQLYADFSSYTDIARGSAYLLGYNLSKNFNNPFYINSVGEFWRKWNISISTWFKEYIYYPLYLTLQRKNYFANINSDLQYKLYYIISISITFILLGLWHDISLNFVAVGIIQSLFLSIEILYSNKTKKLEMPFNVLSYIYPLLVFFFTMIFFFTKNTHDAFLIIKNIFSFTHGKDASIIMDENFALVVIFITFMLISEYYYFTGKLQYLTDSRYIYLRWISYFTLIFIILYFGNFLQKNTFIYESF